MRRSRVVFDFGGWDITVRELIFTPIIIGVMLIIGFIIAGKIDDKIQSDNLKYNSAPHVETVKDFKDRLATDKRFIFSSGKLETVSPVGFSDIYKNLHKCPDSYKLPEGSFLYVEIEREHYTKHTRTVTDGKGHSCEETYYTWDHEETVKKWATKVRFNDVIFSTDKFNFHVYEKTISSEKRGNDRWYFKSIEPVFNGIIFTEVSNGDISNGTDFYVGYDSIDSLIEWLTDGSGLIVFWIIYSILIVTAVVGFWYIDNRWLE